MKLKLIEADNLANILSDNIKDAKGLLGYKLSRNLRLLNEQLTDYYKVKTELFQKYGTCTDGIYSIEKESENYSLFLNEIKQYENEEIEVEFRTISEDDLKDSALNGEVMYLLYDYMIGE